MADPDLTAARARELFRYDAETGVLYRRHAYGERVGTAKSNGYLVVGVGGKNYQTHRVIWLMVHGKWPSGDIDHLNRIKTDNRLDNLRDVAHHVNSRNRPDGKRLQVIGPVPRNGKWFVVLPHYKASRDAGPFETHAEAHDHFARAMRFAAMTEGRERPKLR